MALISPQKLGYLFQDFDIGLCRGIEALCTRRDSATRAEVPLVAVCGPPRTGTTLTFQVATQGLDFWTVSNLHYLFYKSPLIGYLLTRWFTGPYTSNFRSREGFIPGLNGPAQATRFWHYWTGYDLVDSGGHPDPRRHREFVRRLNAIRRREPRPWLGGWVGHAFCMEATAALFRQAYFIRVRRSMLASARSALVSRGNENAKLDVWFSLKPRECIEQPGVSLAQQAARQAYFINRRLDEQQAAMPERVFDAEYTQTCADPRGYIARLRAWLAERGVEVNLRTDTMIPESFKATVTRRNKDEWTERIGGELDALVARHGPVSAPI